MGLDHYLYKKTYVKNWAHMSTEELHNITVKLGGKKRKDIKPERITTIVETVAQWRKFNSLHKWFLDNCQDGEDNCKEHYVQNKKLVELLELLKQVIQLKPSEDEELSNENIEKLNELFPTHSGFFFGGTEYDEYYFSDVENTINILEELFKEDPDGENDYYYDSSW
jgi:hypothetical protein